MKKAIITGISRQGGAYWPHSPPVMPSLCTQPSAGETAVQEASRTHRGPASAV